MSAKRIHFVVLFTAFLDFTGYGIFLPVQAFVAERLGASPFQVTLLSTLFALMMMVFAPFWGWLSDRVGRRPIMLLSLVASVAGYLIFGMAGSLWGLFIARAIAGMGAANAATAQAILCDTTESETRARALGQLGAVLALGFLVGPALGGCLAQWGIGVPAFVAAALCAADLLLAYGYLPETLPAAVGRHGARPAARESLGQTLRRLWSLGEFPRLFLLYATFSSGIAVVQQIVGLFVERVWLQSPATAVSAGGAAGREAAGITAAAFLLVGIVTAVVQGGLVGRLVERFGERRLLAFGTSLVTLGLVAIAAAGDWGGMQGLVAAVVVLSVGLGLTNPTLMSLISQTVGSETLAGDMSLGQSVSDFGRVVGPAAAGLLFELSPSLPFWVASALVAVSGLCAWQLQVARTADASPLSPVVAEGGVR